MKTHPIRLMIDFETPSSDTTTAPLTFGAKQFAAFDEYNYLPPYPFPEFYARASLASIERRGFSISKETMEFWDKQDPTIRAEAFGGTADVASLIDSFIEWCTCYYGADNLKKIELWSRGADFDCKILQNVCMELWGNYPFDFRNHGCQRTLVKTLPSSLIIANVPPQLHKHHALHDAKYQAAAAEFVMATVKKVTPDAYTITA